jgi:RNase H-fold protein (predicted Holliday junction resolvase)
MISCDERLTTVAGTEMCAMTSYEQLDEEGREENSDEFGYVLILYKPVYKREADIIIM